MARRYRARADHRDDFTRLLSWLVAFSSFDLVYTSFRVPSGTIRGFLVERGSSKRGAVMRTVLIALPILIATLFTAAPPAIAQNAAWCSTGSLTGVKDCSFYTLAQCRAALSDDPTGTCSRNPRAARAKAKRPQRY